MLSLNVFIVEISSLNLTHIRNWIHMTHIFSKVVFECWLLGVFIDLILIDGVIILIHHGGRYYYNEVNY